MSWRDSFSKAQREKGRLPSLAEAKAITQAKGYMHSKEMWIPVGTSSNRDWLQVGALPYPKPGTSFKEANGYPAPWSNNDNQKLEFSSMIILKGNC